MDDHALILEPSPQDAAAEAEDFGLWTGYRVPDDRSGWHPKVRRFYEYWLSIAPPGRLPGRRHVAPEDLVPLLPHLWLLDVHRNPLRFRFRLAGTDIVRSAQREVTGGWFDEVHPPTARNPFLRDRYRFIAETGRPTWRRGATFLERDPDHRMIENCAVPLAADGDTVDMIFAISILFDSKGREI